MLASRSHRQAFLALLLLAGGCAPQGGGGGAQPAAPPTSAVLPPDAVVGAGDPTRAAILNAAYAFASPANLAGRPAEAARAVANYEFLAVELPTGPRWREFAPTLAGELAAGRAELRGVLGIAPTAPPQAVIDSLYAASRALRAGDTAAAERILSAPIYTAGGAATLQRLAALPPVPRANVAASHAQAELLRMDQEGRERGPGGVGGRTR